MEKLKMFVVQEPVVAASCLIAGVGLFLPAVVRPMLDSFETSKQVPPPALSDILFLMLASCYPYLILINSFPIPVFIHQRNELVFYQEEILLPLFLIGAS
ncbi:UNVERIFIED_CONTAM: hypothetical protein Sradi_5878600 [Sesamum radiatum]|uniref:Uncharacterized protein n=1 Tax=Sesamum radiatum TaxID=300843 RepID=A0AAW2KRX8_SESRA